MDINASVKKTDGQKARISTAVIARAI